MVYRDHVMTSSQPPFDDDVHLSDDYNSRKEPSRVPFLDAGIVRPDIKKAFYLGNKNNLKEEVSRLKKDLDSILWQSADSVYARSQMVEFINRVNNLVKFAYVENQSVKDQVIVSLLSFYTLLVKAPQVNNTLLSELLTLFVTWGLRHFNNSDGLFFVFSILDTILAHYRVLKKSHRDLLIKHKSVLIKLSRHDDLKTQELALKLLEKLGISSVSKEAVSRPIPLTHDQKTKNVMLPSSRPTYSQRKAEGVVTRRDEAVMGRLRVTRRTALIGNSAGSLLSSIGYYRGMLFQLASEKNKLFDSVSKLLIIERQLNKLVKTLDITKITLVTDRYASVPKDIAALPLIKVLNIDLVHRVKSFVDTYQDIIDKGVGTIITLLPDSRYWLSLHYAQDSISGSDENIFLYDTKTFGFGLGLIIQDLMMGILQKRKPEQLKILLKKTLKNVRYWVVVDSVRKIDNEPWFIRFKDNVEKTFPLVTNKCIFAFHGFPGILGEVTALSQGVQELRQLVDFEISQNEDVFRRAVVVHRQAEEDAQVLYMYLKADYPMLNVTLLSSEDIDDLPFGRHLSVSLI